MDLQLPERAQNLGMSCKKVPDVIPGNGLSEVNDALLKLDYSDDWFIAFHYSFGLYHSNILSFMLKYKL